MDAEHVTGAGQARPIEAVTTAIGDWWERAGELYRRRGTGGRQWGDPLYDEDLFTAVHAGIDAAAARLACAGLGDAAAELRTAFATLHRTVGAMSGPHGEGVAAIVDAAVRRCVDRLSLIDQGVKQNPADPWRPSGGRSGASPRKRRGDKALDLRKAAAFVVEIINGQQLEDSGRGITDVLREAEVRFDTFRNSPHFTEARSAWATLDEARKANRRDRHGRRDGDDDAD